MSQAHQRNYQGNVILTTPHHATKRHKLWGKIAVGVMAVTLVVTSGLLGVMTLHNQNLKQQLQTLENRRATLAPQRDPEKTLSEIKTSSEQQETEKMPVLKI